MRLEIVVAPLPSPASPASPASLASSHEGPPLPPPAAAGGESTPRRERRHARSASPCVIDRQTVILSAIFAVSFMHSLN